MPISQEMRDQIVAQIMAAALAPQQQQDYSQLLGGDTDMSLPLGLLEMSQRSQAQAAENQYRQDALNLQRQGQEFAQGQVPETRKHEMAMQAALGNIQRTLEDTRGGWNVKTTAIPGEQAAAARPGIETFEAGESQKERDARLAMLAKENEYALGLDTQRGGREERMAGERNKLDERLGVGQQDIAWAGLGLEEDKLSSVERQANEERAQRKWELGQNLTSQDKNALLDAQTRKDVAGIDVNSPANLAQAKNLDAQTKALENEGLARQTAIATQRSIDAASAPAEIMRLLDEAEPGITRSYIQTMYDAPVKTILSGPLGPAMSLFSGQLEESATNLLLRQIQEALPESLKKIPPDILLPMLKAEMGRRYPGWSNEDTDMSFLSSSGQ